MCLPRLVDRLVERLTLKEMLGRFGTQGYSYGIRQPEGCFWRRVSQGFLGVWENLSFKNYIRLRSHVFQPNLTVIPNLNFYQMKEKREF